MSCDFCLPSQHVAWPAVLLNLTAHTLTRVVRESDLAVVMPDSSLPVLVACTTAYPEAAGTLAPNLTLNIADQILAHFASLPNPPVVTLTHYPRVSDTFTALQSASSTAATYAVVPIESSETGSFRSVYELIVNHGCFIVGEFASSSALPTNTPSTASSTLWTRFVLLCRTAAPLSSSLSFGSARESLKSSAVLGLSHEAGSVHRILSCFSMRHINVLKFELRPATPSSFLSPASSASSAAASPPTSVPSSPRHSAASPFLSTHAPSQWTYVFYCDWEIVSGSGSEATNAAVLANLREFSEKLVHLGTYKQNMQVRDVEELVVAW